MTALRNMSQHNFLKMATGGYLEKSSDSEFGKLNCSHCSTEGIKIVAIKLCIDCDELFCRKCFENHNKFRSMKDHTTKDLMIKDEEKNMQNSSEEVLVCSKHPDKAVEMYCGDEDILCCAVCMALFHRSCQYIEYLPDVEQSISKLQNQLADKRTKKENDLQIIEEQKTALINEVEHFKLKLIEKVQQMGQLSIKNIDEIFETPINKTKEDIQALQNVKETADKSMENSKVLTKHNDADKILKYMQNWKGNRTKGDKLLEEIEICNEIETTWIKFEEHEEYESVFKEKKSLGEVVDERNCKYYVTSEQKKNAKASEDKKTCHIFGICQLENGKIVLADFNNKNLKVLDTAYQIIGNLDMKAGPWAVCNTSCSQVAVTLRDEEKIQFVSTENDLKMLHSFDVGATCRGVAYCNEQLYVSCEGNSGETQGHIRIYELSGTLTRKLITNSDNDFLVTVPYNLIITKDGQRLYVADRTKGLIILQGPLLNETAEIGSNYKHGIIGLCLQNDSKCFVCGWNSNNIAYKNDNEKVLSLLSTQAALRCPQAILYDKMKSALIVAQQSCNDLVVLKLAKQKE